MNDFNQTLETKRLLLSLGSLSRQLGTLSFMLRHQQIQGDVEILEELLVGMGDLLEKSSTELAHIASEFDRMYMRFDG